MNVQQRLYDRKPPPAVESVVAPARTAKPRKGFVKRCPVIIMAIVALLVVAIGIGALYSRSTNTAQPLIFTATRGDVEDLVTALGSLQPFSSVDIGAQVSGQLKYLRVKIGDNVEQGQLLAEIDAQI